MGPLVPQGIISPEWDFIIALLIGIGFGYILEAAGFSTSRKLVGLFYGYDFVVLRVFFTGGATAVAGIILMDYFGWIDVSMLYVQPTYWGAAIAGGLIMGLGFVTGGFCPGTSFAASSIGKVDAMMFVVGTFIGAFIYGETYPLIKDFVNSGNEGGIKIYDTLGMSRGLFAFLLIVVAVGMFYFVPLIEKKVKEPEY
jgi:hypothetical protein